MIQKERFAGLSIEKNLGDKDVLGARIIENTLVEKNIRFKFNGIHKLDRYEYVITINW